jgi:glycine cleavage system aminomethyltransferase T/glycine/D-amino acid oxidase-like deaminating enzyme
MIADRHHRIVIIGAGAIGCALAYSLARAGETDVLVLEKAQITHGSTWHAAGLVGQLRGKRALTRLMQNSVAVFDRLEQETGLAIDWKKVGSLRLAASEARWSEIRRSMQLAKSFGFEAHQVSPAEAKNMFPHIDPKGVVGAAFVPSDGYIDPYALTMAYASAARRAGIRIEEGVRVTAIPIEGRRALGVVTDHGTVSADVVVNCAGYWARRVGAMANVALAAGVVEHQYFVTEKGLDLPPNLTTLRDPDKNFYLKPDVGGAFAIGGWEDGAPGCWKQSPPFDFARELFPANMDRLSLFALPAAERLPILNDIGIRTIINGPIPVSADGEPVMGLAPELDNFFVACGFTAGIAASGGAGEAMANWILHGDPGLDLWPFDVRRFGPPQARAEYLDQRAAESYAAYYKIHWPGEEAHSARGLRRSPVHGALAEAGAVFGSRFGWERPNWFSSSSPDATETPSFEERPGWHSAVAAEVHAIRNGVALIDQTSFSKFEITGKGCGAALDRIAAGMIQGEPGRVIYTQMLNPRGGIEADVTFLHLGPDRYFMVTGSGFGIRDSNWLMRHLPDGIAVREVTNAYATLNLCGPRAREVLSRVTAGDLSSGAFPFLGLKEIEIGMAPVIAARVGYVGELGWEIYIPVDYAAYVFDTLVTAGAASGLRHAGYRAIESCRLEKGYLYLSSDISPVTTPLEAGLGFAVAWDKGDFIGRAALERQRTDGPSRRLVTLSVPGFAPLLSGETVLSEGRPVASLTSAGYGHHLDRSIGFAYLPVELAEQKHFVIEAFGTRHAATRGPRCLHDPRMERLKA